MNHDVFDNLRIPYGSSQIFEARGVSSDGSSVIQNGVTINMTRSEANIDVNNAKIHKHKKYHTSPKSKCHMFCNYLNLRSGICNNHAIISDTDGTSNTAVFRCMSDMDNEALTSFYNVSNKNKHMGFGIPENNPLNQKKYVSIIRTNNKYKSDNTHIISTDKLHVGGRIGDYVTDVDIMKENGVVDHSKGFDIYFPIEKNISLFLTSSTGTIEKLKYMKSLPLGGNEFTTLKYDAFKNEYPGSPISNEDIPPGCRIAIIKTNHNSSIVEVSTPMYIQQDSGFYFPLYDTEEQAQNDPFNENSTTISINIQDVSYYMPDLDEQVYHIYKGNNAIGTNDGIYIGNRESPQGPLYFSQEHASSLSTSSKIIDTPYGNDITFWVPFDNSVAAVYTADVVDYNFLPTAYTTDTVRSSSVFSSILYVNWRQSIARSINGFISLYPQYSSSVKEMFLNSQNHNGFANIIKMDNPTDESISHFDVLLYMTYTLFYDSGYYNLQKAIPLDIDTNYDYMNVINTDNNVDVLTRIDGHYRSIDTQMNMVLNAIVRMNGNPSAVDIDIDKIRHDLYPDKKVTLLISNDGSVVIQNGGRFVCTTPSFQLVKGTIATIKERLLWFLKVTL